jgi:hypothetical protein
MLLVRSPDSCQNLKSQEGGLICGMHSPPDTFFIRQYLLDQMVLKHVTSAVSYSRSSCMYPSISCVPHDF